MTTQAIVQDGFYREFVCKAMALELASLREESGGFADRTRKVSYSIVEHGPGYAGKRLSDFGLGNIWQATIAFPPAAIAVAAVASLVWLKNVASFIDYTGDKAAYEQAMQVCLFATQQQLLTLNYLVSGSLLRFLQEAVIARFTGRIEALEKLAKLSDTDEIASRLPLYKAGLHEAMALHLTLTEIHQALVAMRDMGLKETLEHTAAQKTEIEAANNLVELHYQAGLISKEEYRAKKLENHKNRAINMGVKLGAHAVHKTVRIDDDGRDITYFVNEFFYGGAGNGLVEVKKPWFWKTVGLAILVCAIGGVGYYALSDILTPHEQTEAVASPPVLANAQPSAAVPSPSLEAKYKELDPTVPAAGDDALINSEIELLARPKTLADWQFLAKLDKGMAREDCGDAAFCYSRVNMVSEAEKRIKERRMVPPKRAGMQFLLLRQS